MQSLDRSLDLLEALGSRPVSRVRDLARDTGLPAPTVVRLLSTLARRGYVRRLDGRAGYCLTARITGLAAGFHGFAAALGPVCRAADTLTEEFRWPASVCTFDTDAMVVHYSTLPVSPLGHKHSTVARRLDMLERAHGRAWMAFSEPEARLRILGTLAATGRLDGPPEAALEALGPTWAAIRESGLARRAAGVEPDTSTLAVPVFAGARMVATLGVTHFARGLPDPAPLAARLRALGLAAGRADPPQEDHPE